jgi:hypothetical protein
MKTAVRSGEIKILIELIKKQGLTAHIEEATADTLSSIPTGDRVYGFPKKLSVNDRILLMDVSCVRDDRPNQYYLITIKQ